MSPACNAPLPATSPCTRRRGAPEAGHGRPGPPARRAAEAPGLRGGWRPAQCWLVYRAKRRAVGWGLSDVRPGVWGPQTAPCKQSVSERVKSQGSSAAASRARRRRPAAGSELVAGRHVAVGGRVLVGGRRQARRLGGAKHHVRRHRVAGQPEGGGDGQQLALAGLRGASAGAARPAVGAARGRGAGSALGRSVPAQAGITAWHSQPAHPAVRAAMTRCSCAVMGMLAGSARCAAAATTLQAGGAACRDSVGPAHAVGQRVHHPAAAMHAQPGTLVD